MNQNAPNEKLIRWRSEIGPYTFTYIHIPGIDLPLEDYSSRSSIPTDNPFKTSTANEKKYTQMITNMNIKKYDHIQLISHKNDNISNILKNSSTIITAINPEWERTKIYDNICTINDHSLIKDDINFDHIQQLFTAQSIFNQTKERMKKFYNTPIHTFAPNILTRLQKKYIEDNKLSAFISKENKIERNKNKFDSKDDQDAKEDDITNNNVVRSPNH